MTNQPCQSCVALTVLMMLVTGQPLSHSQHCPTAPHNKEYIFSLSCLATVEPLRCGVNTIITEIMGVTSYLLTAQYVPEGMYFQHISSVFLFSFLSLYIFAKCLKAWANHNYGQGLGTQFSGPGPSNCHMSPSSLLPYK